MHSYKKIFIFFSSLSIFVESIIDLIEYCNNNLNQISKQLELNRKRESTKFVPARIETVCEL